jgi:hypothetical protein
LAIWAAIWIEQLKRWINGMFDSSSWVKFICL